ncbi:hypothetical protein ACBR40_34700 [Nonomuraea sp. AD125B]|uniref:hypothetical protein n=1 Tax=Nonomuraea sp. AD125B TaxID=3242897 RepID=UPI003528A942
MDTRLPDAPQGDVPKLAAAELPRNGLAGLAYAYVTQHARVADLRALIDDPRIRAIRLADVAYDLTGLN